MGPLVSEAAAQPGVSQVTRKAIPQGFAALDLAKRRAALPSFLVCYMPLAVKNVGVELTSRRGALRTRKRPRHSSRKTALGTVIFGRRLGPLTAFCSLCSVLQFMSSRSSPPWRNCPRPTAKPRAASPHCDPKHPNGPEPTLLAKVKLHIYPASESKTSHYITRRRAGERRSLFWESRRAAPRANSRSTPCS